MKKFLTRYWSWKNRGELMEVRFNFRQEREEDTMGYVIKNKKD